MYMLSTVLVNTIAAVPLHRGARMLLRIQWHELSRLLPD